MHAKQGQLFTSTYGDNNLVFWVILGVKLCIQIIAKCFTQLRHTCIRCITGHASFERIHACFTHMPRCYEIRFPTPSVIISLLSPTRSKTCECPMGNLLNQWSQIRGHCFLLLSVVFSFTIMTHLPLRRDHEDGCLPDGLKNNPVLFIFLRIKFVLVDSTESIGDNFSDTKLTTSRRFRPLYFNKQIICSRHEVNGFYLRIEIDSFGNALEATSTLGCNLDFNQSCHFLIINFAPVHDRCIFHNNMFLFKLCYSSFYFIFRLPSSVDSSAGVLLVFLQQIQNFGCRSFNSFIVFPPASSRFLK